MIRREVGNEFYLISQTDHAAVAAHLSSMFGNDKFSEPFQRELLVSAVKMHDDGWPIHDDCPTLNISNIPLDVFEVPRSIALQVWAASSERASAFDSYVGLLVSLHSLSLSVYATSASPGKHEKFDARKMQDQFAVNKFQHREIERQETLRRKLKLDTSIPLKLGLAEPHASRQEDRILFDFRLLQAMDLMSLGLCCSKLPQGETNDVLSYPSADPTKLKLRRSPDGVLHVAPWPFRVSRIEISVPFRRVPAKKFGSLEEFRSIYLEAAVETLPLVAAV